ncbi:cupin domain-containing protein [Flavobacterium terrisoli]|uniref:cupin domain-containing protein n=1 Tax=Flavobacterium terrisoli TaxID=3242195 RepID=UPI0025436B3A|nr:cupin domain-containing protein [Flavobacterium buctense]
MKTTIKKSMNMLTVFFLLLSVQMYAQDPVAISPKNYPKVLLENEFVRVLQFEMAPGDVIPWHSHPNHVAYVVAPGKIEITNKGEAPVTFDVKAGEALFLPAVTHTGKNTGKTTIKLIITEIRK